MCTVVGRVMTCPNICWGVISQKKYQKRRAKCQRAKVSAKWGNYLFTNIGRDLLIRNHFNFTVSTSRSLGSQGRSLQASQTACFTIARFLKIQVFKIQAAEILSACCPDRETQKNRLCPFHVTHILSPSASSWLGVPPVSSPSWRPFCAGTPKLS